MHYRHSGLLEKYGTRLNIIGRTSLLPAELQAVVKKAEALTKDNNKWVLIKSLFSLPLSVYSFAR
jgi:ditrans,polycis-polyprenyl diphosphate synthase